jgi:hypothetical protein
MGLDMEVSHAAAIPRMDTDRAPHIGEYAVKTNAIGEGRQRDRGRIEPAGGGRGRGRGREAVYWPWFFRTCSQAGVSLVRFC